MFGRTFLTLFSAQLISQLGSGVTTVGLALFAYQIAPAQQATAVLGDALMLRILAFLLFSQPAGVLADRVSRKGILIAADLARCALLGLFPFVTTVFQIEALVFAINAVTAFFTPTFEASLPEVVGPEHYTRALSLSRVAVDVETVGGPVVAGLLCAWLGVRWVFWFDAASYLCSAALIATVAVPRAAPAAAQALGGMRRFLSEITHGTRVLLREPSLRQALLLSMAEATAGASAIVVTVAYVKEQLHRGATVFSLVMAGLSVGSAGAALVLGRLSAKNEVRAGGPAALHERRHVFAARALIVGGVLLGLALLPGALLPPLPLFAALWVLNGVGQALVAIPSATLLAEHTFEEERGRAYAAHFALTHAFWLIAYPAVGHAALRLSAPRTFTCAGLVCLLVTAAAALLGRGRPGEHSHTRHSG